MLFAMMLVYFTKLGILSEDGHAGYAVLAFCEVMVELMMLGAWLW